MNRKSKRLIDKAIKARADRMFGDSDKCAKYDKVVNYVDDWGQVREYIRREATYTYRELEYFEGAALRYNASVREPELTNKQKAGTLVGTGLVGLAIGLRHDPNKRGFRVLPKRKDGWG